MIAVDEIAREQGLEPKEVIEFLRDFLAYTKAEELPALKRAVVAGDFRVIKQRAHSIKGAALNLKLERVAEFARDIETLGISGSLDGSDRLMVELETALKDLETWLDGLT